MPPVLPIHTRHLFRDTLWKLLPPNATPLERDLLKLAPFEKILDPAIPAIYIEKGNIGGGDSLTDQNDEPLTNDEDENLSVPIIPSFNETISPWLEIEYGLRLIEPFISDPARRIQEGLLFLSRRGTPAALLQGLGWIGFSAAIIREEVIETIHFPEYQIILDRKPTYKEVVSIIRLSRIAQPVRSVLRRIVWEYDNSRFTLDDENGWGCVLDNYSGRWMDRVLPLGIGTTDMWISTSSKIYLALTNEFELPLTDQNDEELTN